MIDTDKYEGHTLNHPIHMDEPNPHDGGHREMLCDGGIIGWLQMDDYPSADANAMLLADAPLLLTEVKRLREALLRIADTANGRPFISGHMDSFVGEVLKELIE